MNDKPRSRWIVWLGVAGLILLWIVAVLMGGGISGWLGSATADIGFLILLVAAAAIVKTIRGRKNRP